jgi:hypothetical protein
MGEYLGSAKAPETQGKVSDSQQPTFNNTVCDFFNDNQRRDYSVTGYKNGTQNIVQ